MHSPYRLIFTAGICLLLAACGSFYVPEPVGIGKDIDQLKLSPCACLEIPQDYSDWSVAG